MAKIEVKLNRKGIAAYLKDRSVYRELDKRGAAGARKAGPGYRHGSTTGKRARSSVYTASAQARRDNSQNQTLLRVMGGRL